jgi:pimeloyl-ACP methyl ester carboxylesterase
MAEPAARRRKRGCAYFARLGGFGLMAFVTTALGLMLIFGDAQARSHVAPAPSSIEPPPDLAFTPESVRFPGGSDALTGEIIQLAGWFVPPQNGATLILLHGYGGSRLGMVWHAERLIEAGYGALLVDERASGASSGTARAFGWPDVDDVGGALAWLRARADVDMNQIGILGCSVGGQIALRAAAAYPEIAAVIADGPSMAVASDLPPPASLFDWLSLIPNRVYDRRLSDLSGVPIPPGITAIIGQIAPRPLLLIAGGTSVGAAGSEAGLVGHYLNFAGDNATLWVIDDAVHCDGPVVQPQAYRQRMLDFLAAAFSG